MRSLLFNLVQWIVVSSYDNYQVRILGLNWGSSTLHVSSFFLCLNHTYQSNSNCSQQLYLYQLSLFGCLQSVNHKHSHSHHVFLIASKYFLERKRRATKCHGGCLRASALNFFGFYCMKKSGKVQDLKYFHSFQKIG